MPQTLCSVTVNIPSSSCAGKKVRELYAPRLILQGNCHLKAKRHRGRDNTIANLHKTRMFCVSGQDDEQRVSYGVVPPPVPFGF